MKVEIYTLVWRYVKEHGKLPTPGYLSLKDKTSRNYYISRLKKNNYIKKLGYGTWEVTGKNIQDFQHKKVELFKYGSTHQPKPGKKEIRGHAFVFKLKVPPLENWSRRSEYMDAKHIQYKELASPKGTQRIFIWGKKVWLSRHSIVIYDKDSYIADTAKNSKSYAISNMLDIVRSIENLFNANFKIQSRYVFKVSRQHYAKMHDSLARQYRKDGKKLYVANDKGLWLIADYSLEIDDLETIHSETGQKDMDNAIVPVLNSIKKNPGFTFDSILMGFQKTQETLKGVVDNQAHHEKNIRSHTGAMQGIGKGVKELTIGIREDKVWRKEQTEISRKLLSAIKKLSKK